MIVAKVMEGDGDGEGEGEEGRAAKEGSTEACAASRRGGSPAALLGAVALVPLLLPGERR